MDLFQALGEGSAILRSQLTRDGLLHAVQVLPLLVQVSHFQCCQLILNLFIMLF